ncbi:SPOR domain-containing protein [bacterium]|nr:SPOR domain-containing protein [bacterium]
MASKENKKKKNKESTTVSIFLITFIVTFAFVALSVKYFSPEIDVEIEGKEQIAEEDVEKGSVDERLRWIQFEDNMPGVSTRFTEETENTQKTKNDNVIVYDEENNENNEIEKLEEVQEVKPLIATPVPSINKISKVYVGQFSNIEQAIAMQNKLTDAGLDLAPFVKRIDNYYVVQIGSYASKEKAQAVVLQVQGAGFPAQLVNE